jgi:hypothetical protein
MALSDAERVLAEGYLGDLRARPIEEIRAMRAECQRIEVALSYMRRLVQGRIDIVAAELQRRAGGAGPSGLAEIVEHLPEILTGREAGQPRGVGRLPTLMAPSEADEAELRAELDAVAGEELLARLPETADEEVRSVLDRLSDLERVVSARRRALHERIDALQAELTRRYKSGEASVESLLR